MAGIETAVVHCELLNQLGPEQARSMLWSARSRRMPARTAVFVPGERSESLYILVSGTVKISHLTSDGKELILAIVEPGAIFGEESVVGVGRRDVLAMTLEPCEVLIVPASEFRRCLDNHPAAAQSFARLMVERRRRIEERLKHIIYLPQRERLVHALLDLLELFGEPCSHAIQLRVRLTHQEWAALIGATRETVTSILLELRAEGLLAVGRRRLVLTDVARLAALVGRKPPSDIFPVSPNTAATTGPH